MPQPQPPQVQPNESRKRRRAVPPENFTKGKKIMLVGEAPGEDEEREGRPFCGASGRLLNKILFLAGIDRKDCCVSNVVDTKPERNDFSCVSGAELYLQSERLRREILHVQPNVIVAIGGKALQALTKQTSITNYRGSILHDTSTDIKVIPTLHPAYILRSWPTRFLGLADFQRVKKHAESAEPYKEERKLIYANDFGTAVECLDEILHSKAVAFDIETGSQSCTHIAFSDDANRAFSIPFWEGRNVFTKHEELILWKRIRAILESPILKYAQNAQYDITFLRRVLGIRTNALQLDTMAAHHILFPEFEKSLGYLCSIYIEIPYYKDELHSEDPKEKALYNAKDACVTFEIAQVLQKLLKEASLDTFYYKFVHPLLDPLMDMQCRGVKINLTLREQHRERLGAELVKLKASIDEEIGWELNPNSPKQVKELIYTQLSLPHIYKRGTSTLTTGKEALNKLYAKTGNEVLRHILEYRQLSDKLSVCNTALKDGRIHTSYNVAASIKQTSAFKTKIVSAPVTGRLSSSADIFRIGTNLQNITLDLRDMFIPDEGMKFMAVDLSQAEAWATAYQAEATEMITLMEKGVKIHAIVASKVFGKTPEECKSGTEEYKIGKRIVHASNYGMEAKTYSEHAGITVSAAQEELDKYLNSFPALRRYHERIEKEIFYGDPPTLETPLGRRRTFWDRPSKKKVKEALAYIPQSLVADVLNQCGVVILSHLLRARGISAEVLLQVHDEVVIQYEPSEEKILLETIEEAFNFPIPIHGRTLVIPYEYNIGDNWKQTK